MAAYANRQAEHAIEEVLQDYFQQPDKHFYY